MILDKRLFWSFLVIHCDESAMRLRLDKIYIRPTWGQLTSDSRMRKREIHKKICIHDLLCPLLDVLARGSLAVLRTSQLTYCL